MNLALEYPAATYSLTDFVFNHRIRTPQILKVPWTPQVDLSPPIFFTTMGPYSSRPTCRNGGPGTVRQGGATAIFCPFNFLWRNLQRTQKFTIFLANLLPPSIKAIWVSVTNVVSIPS